MTGRTERHHIDDMIEATERVLCNCLECCNQGVAVIAHQATGGSITT